MAVLEINNYIQVALFKPRINDRWFGPMEKVAPMNPLVVGSNPINV